MAKRITKIVLIDNKTSEYILLANKGILAKYINIPRETIVNWFRDGTKQVEYYNYTIIRLDRYINKMGK